MTRRTFFKIFPLAGLAAAFGIKLKAEPEFIYYTKAADTVRERPIYFQSVGRGLRPNYKGECIILDYCPPMPSSANSHQQ